MDFTRMNCSPDDLTKKQRIRHEGMQYIHKLIDDFADHLDEHMDYDEDSLIDGLKYEVGVEILEELSVYVENFIDEYIVHCCGKNYGRALRLDPESLSDYIQCACSCSCSKHNPDSEQIDINDEDHEND